MIVQTFRLELGPPRVHDAQLLYDALKHSQITHFMASDGPHSLAEYRHQLRRWREEHRRDLAEHFILRCRETELPMGSVSFPEIAPGRRLLSYWLAESHQGRGYMSEALGRLLGWAYYQLPLQEAEAFVFVGNLASRRVLEKNGFYLAEYVSHHRRKHHRWVDAWRFVLTRSGYEQRPLYCESLGVA